MPDDKSLKDYALEYLRQIESECNADNEALALMILKEFGQKSYARGWNAAMDAVKNYADETRSKD